MLEPFSVTQTATIFIIKISDVAQGPRLMCNQGGVTTNYTDLMPGVFIFERSTYDAFFFVLFSAACAFGKDGAQTRDIISPVGTTPQPFNDIFNKNKTEIHRQVLVYLF